MGANTVTPWTPNAVLCNRADFATANPNQARRATWNRMLSVAADYCVHFLFVTLGLSLTAVGLASIVLPLVPSTTTLLASSYFLTRSCPSLQHKLNQIPLLGTMLKYLDGTRVMSHAAQYGFTIYLWGNLVVTLAFLYGIGLANYPTVSINIFCCVLSTVFLLKLPAEPTKVSQVKEAARVVKSTAFASDEQPLKQPHSPTNGLGSSLVTLGDEHSQAGVYSGGLPYSAMPIETPAS